jgi:hypothetical protein
VEGAFAADRRWPTLELSEADRYSGELQLGPEPDSGLNPDPEPEPGLELGFEPGLELGPEPDPGPELDRGADTGLDRGLDE